MGECNSVPSHDVHMQALASEPVKYFILIPGAKTWWGICCLGCFAVPKVVFCSISVMIPNSSNHISSHQCALGVSLVGCFNAVAQIIRQIKAVSIQPICVSTSAPTYWLCVGFQAPPTHYAQLMTMVVGAGRQHRFTAIVAPSEYCPTCRSS